MLKTARKRPSSESAEPRHPRGVLARFGGITIFALRLQGERVGDRHDVGALAARAARVVGLGLVDLAAVARTLRREDAAATTGSMPRKRPPSASISAARFSRMSLTQTQCGPGCAGSVSIWPSGSAARAVRARGGERESREGSEKREHLRMTRQPTNRVAGGKGPPRGVRVRSGRSARGRHCDLAQRSRPLRLESSWRPARDSTGGGTRRGSRSSRSLPISIFFDLGGSGCGRTKATRRPSRETLLRRACPPRGTAGPSLDSDYGFRLVPRLFVIVDTPRLGLGGSRPRLSGDAPGGASRGKSVSSGRGGDPERERSRSSRRSLRPHADRARARALRRDPPHRRAALPPRALSGVPGAGRPGRRARWRGFAPANYGVFMGYDFHLTPDGPAPDRGQHQRRRRAAERPPHRGALRSREARLPVLGLLPVETIGRGSSRPSRRSSRPCAAPARAARASRSPTSGPREQFLHPEFELFAELFARAGIEARVCDTRELATRRGRLELARRADRSRLPARHRLRAGAARAPRRCARRTWRAKVVVTPSPREHHLLADKRRLALFSSRGGAARARRRRTRMRASSRAVVPETRPLADAGRSSAPGATRREWVFKPAAAFGEPGRLPRRQDLAQEARRDRRGCRAFSRSAGSSRARSRRDARAARAAMKFDVRAYAYRDEVLLLGARVYQGQVTNLRSPGGGFSAICVVRDDAARGNQWRARHDSNMRPLGPQPSALSN